MNMREMALVGFTILAQMSVGSFVVLGVAHFFAARRVGREAAERLSDPALLAIGPVLALAFAASVFHLGNPLNAVRTLNNLGTSWLSREIFFGGAFAVLGALFAAMQWFKWGSAGLRQTLAAVTALVGLALVYVMARVYMLPTVPAWNSWATPVRFFATTFLLGSLAVGAAFVVETAWRKSKDEATLSLVRASLRWIALAAIVLLGVQFVVLPTYVAQLAAQGGAAAASAALLVQGGGWLFIARLLLVFLGAGLLGFFLYKYSAGPGQERLMAAAAVSAFALVFISEVLGRMLFYAGYMRIGL